jgi:hypothetical protein
MSLCDYRQCHIAHLRNDKSGGESTVRSNTFHLRFTSKSHVICMPPNLQWYIVVHHCQLYPDKQPGFFQPGIGCYILPRSYKDQNLTSPGRALSLCALPGHSSFYNSQFPSRLFALRSKIRIQNPEVPIPACHVIQVVYWGVEANNRILASHSVDYGRALGIFM